MIHGQYIVNALEGEEFAGEGIKGKVNDQIKLMADNLIDCRLTVMYRKPQKLGKKIASHCLPGTADPTNWDETLIDSKTQFLYIRRPSYFSSDFISFLERIKTIKPNIKIYLEIPTYPYEREYKAKQFPLLIKDVWNRRHLYKYVNYIVDLFGNKTLFNIPTLEIKNGIVVTDGAKRSPSGAGNKIKMICAANFCPWHGIDRLINGMANYYANGGNRDITLTLIGGGEEISKYKKLVKKYNLNSKVSFYGQVPRSELKKFYDVCNLGVESLARHRTGGDAPNSSLKSRDYLNVGLPFFGEGIVDVLSGTDFPYYLEVDANENPINLLDIISFFDSIYENQSEQDIINAMHDYAEKTVDLNITFSEVISAIKRDCNQSYY